MTGVIEFSECDESSAVVVLGDDKASQKISFQLAQDFYNEITGKSERLKELSNDSFILKLHDIEQLHYRLEQSTEQYNICSFNESYSVSYVDDSSERFSSIERLKLHVGTRGSAIEEIVVQYKMLIVLPKTNRPQEYKITVKMASRVARIESMRKEFGTMPFEIPLFHFENAKTASFEIEYIDSTVAHAFMSVLKKWFNSLEKNSTTTTIKTIRKLSQFIPKLTKYSLLTIACLYIYNSSSMYLLSLDVNARSITLFTLSSILVSYLSLRIGMAIGKIIESNLDSIYEQSYINFSSADDNFVKQSSINIRKSKINALSGLIITFLVGISCSLIANWIGS